MELGAAGARTVISASLAAALATSACVGRIDERSMADASAADRATSARDDVIDSGPDRALPDVIVERDSAMDAADAVAPDTGIEPVSERICEPWAAPTDIFDQSVVPVEVEPRAASAKKIVLVAGAPSPSHPMGAHQFFAVTAVLAKLLCRVPGVVPVIVRDGWPTRESLLDNAAAIVFYADGGASHPLDAEARRAALRSRLSSRTGLVNVHYALEYTAASASEARAWLGGTYEPGYSVNPLWRAQFSAFSSHPITRGVGAFDIDDEWYYGLRWVDDRSAITDLLTATPPDGTRSTPETMAHPGRSEVTAWAFNRPDGGRSVGFTGGHWYGNWLDSPDTPNAHAQRRVVVQSILWAAGVDIPMSGVDVSYAPTDNERYLDRR